MSHIMWTDNLNTGISAIDKQHHRIVDYINALDDISSGPNRHKLGGVLHELVEYTFSHFAFEESLMEEANYAFLNGHKKMHEMFTRRVDEFVQRFNEGEDITDELLNTLRTWLIYHIKTDDNDYAVFVKNAMGRGESVNDESWLTRSVRRFFA